MRLRPIEEPTGRHYCGMRPSQQGARVLGLCFHKAKEAHGHSRQREPRQWLSCCSRPGQTPGILGSQPHSAMLGQGEVAAGNLSQPHPAPGPCLERPPGPASVTAKAPSVPPPGSQKSDELPGLRERIPSCSLSIHCMRDHMGQGNGRWAVWAGCGSGQIWLRDARSPSPG